MTSPVQPPSGGIKTAQRPTETAGMGVEESSPWAELARTHGPDVMIETMAQCYGAILPQLGDALRDLWRDIRPLLIRPLLVDYGASSGAAHELEYYGNP